MEMARSLPEWKPLLGERSNPLEWVRTQDGWERSLVLQPGTQEPGLVHPLVVAGLQLLVSMLVLLAFPLTGSQAPLTGNQAPLTGS
jgi:hypothetical protein